MPRAVYGHHNKETEADTSERRDDRFDADDYADQIDKHNRAAQKRYVLRSVTGASH